MFNLNYLKRLTLHGSRLVWRVGLILLPVIGHSLWEALKSSLSNSSNDNDHPNVVIGSYMEAWEAFDRGQIGAAEMAYYREVYED